MIMIAIILKGELHALVLFTNQKPYTNIYAHLLRPPISSSVVLNSSISASEWKLIAGKLIAKDPLDTTWWPIPVQFFKK